MEEAQGGCISHRMRGNPRAPERSFPRSTKKGEKSLEAPTVERERPGPGRAEQESGRDRGT